MTQPRPAAPRLRRGRPLEGHAPFEAPTRAAYLDLIRHGMNLGDAAQHLGINRSTPTRHSRVDHEFAVALTDARTVGAKVRQEGIPHGEYRYNILGCRCPKCRTAATEGRAGRRAAEDPPGDDGNHGNGGQVHPIRAAVGESLPSFLLARAS